MSKDLLKILFIEDDRSDVELVEYELRGLATVETVESQRGLDEALKKTWDVVLADLRIPELDGQVAISTVKKVSPLTPVIIVTGSVDDETAAIACQAGACDYLRKDRLRRLRMAVTNACESAERAIENEERKKREVANQQAELLGQLSIGLSHDLNGVLGVIMAGTDMLRRNISREDGRILDAMESSTRHGAEMIKQLLLFAAGEGGTFKVITPAYLLGKIAAMLRGTFPSNITLAVVTPPGTAQIRCNELEMTKCILNLALNSRDAMRDGGKLIIAAQNATEPDGLFVQLSIKDTGHGIPQEVIPLIFTPFFTTKSHGTGLGLSMAKKIISDHHGKVEVTSGVNGTEFRILLPAHGEDIKTEKPEFDGHGKHVLLVEDTEFLRTWTKLFLEESNYVVHEASSGAEAMNVFLAHSEEICVLISDVWLPVMSGPKLAKALLELNSALPLIFVTGLDADVAIEPTPAATLQKPFTRESLLLELQRVLLTNARLSDGGQV
jgi:two-component system, cell cycle sensor histidine kinase and response regulator CckA